MTPDWYCSLGDEEREIVDGTVHQPPVQQRSKFAASMRSARAAIAVLESRRALRQRSKVADTGALS